MACLGRFTIQLVDDEITCLPLSRTMKLRSAGNSIYPSVHFPWLAVFGIGALGNHSSLLLIGGGSELHKRSPGDGGTPGLGFRLGGTNAAWATTPLHATHY